MSKFELTDDGTLDTVVRCRECGQEERYNFDPETYAEDPEFLESGQAYEEFVFWAIEDAEQLHDCEADDA